MSSSGALLVDRFVSASSANDARNSLQAICTALQSTNEDHLEPSSIWGEENILEGFLEVLISSEYRNMPVDQGAPLICQIYTEFLESRESKIILQQPEPGRLVHSLLDVISNIEDSSYARVSSLQLLQKICSKYPSIAQAQLLEVPNGLHRLADSFTEENEQVRNEVVLLATTIAQWPSCAKIWVFADACDNVIDLAVKEGGLTKGNFLVRDCLDLLHSLLKHDASLSDLVWQSSSFARKLSLLMDLRRGSEFLDPPKSSPSPSQSDDLDDILQQSTTNESEKVVIPRLTSDEETVLEKAIVLINVMLSSEKIRIIAWKQHPALGSLLWELALFSPPPPGVPQVCALPSASLQQKALECVALFFASSDMMQYHNGLDRLLFLVCTGGATDNLDQKIGLSQSALHVIRQLVTDEMANEIVMHTLAPPILMDAPETEPTVVLKLVNTVLENVESTEKNERRETTLLGALGALGVFLRDTTSREMVLRILSPHSLIDTILKSLDSQSDIIAMAFLRFLSDLMIETPAVVETILSCSQSMALSILFGSTGTKATLAGLLLGIAMESMEDKNSEKCGGWTRSSIITMISRRQGGVTSFVSELEALKKIELPWKACQLEEQVFIKWYNAQVLMVRGRIVQELTGGGQGGEGEECPKGVSSKDLQDLVTRQSQELEEVRKELAVANDAIQSRNSQIEVWERRVESSPTQLDDMLTEYTTKNEELNRDILSLKNELKRDKDSHEKCLSEKESEVATLKEKREETLKVKQEAESETERLMAELAALSSAYSSLEEEYNQSQSRASSGEVADALSGEAPNNSSHLEGQQPQGEVSSQGQGGSEVEAIQLENLRLRNDAKAADEWMQLAHQRMVEIETENKQLKQETLTLRASPEEINSGSNLSTHEQETEDQLEVTNALRSLEESEKENIQLREEISDLKTDLELAKASSTALNEERRQLERQLASHGDGQHSAEGELVIKLRKDLETKQVGVDSLQASLKTLQDESINRRVELEEIVNLKDELEIRGQRIKELENRVTQHKFTSQGENEENMESVAKKELEAKCTSYKSEIEQLSKEMIALRADNKSKSDKLEDLTSKLEEFQRWSMAAQEKLTSLAAEKEAIEGKLEEAKNSTTRSGMLQGESAEELQDLSRKLEEEKLMKADFEATCASYKNEIEQLSKDILLTREDDKTKCDELQNMTTKLDDFQQWSVAAQENLSSLMVEKEAIEKELEEVKGSVTDSSITEKTVENLGKELEAQKGEKLVLEGKCTSYENEIEKVSKEISGLRDDNKIKSNELQDATAKLEEFQQWSAIAQEKLSSLTAEKEATEKELEEVKGSMTDSSITEKTVENLGKELEAQKGEKLILEEKCTSYENEIEKVSKEISGLRDDNKIKSNELQDATAKLEEFQKWSAIAQEKLLSLTAEKEAVEKELEEVKVSLVDPVATQESVEDLQGLNDKLKTEKVAIEDHAKVIELELNNSLETISMLESAIEENESQLKISKENLQQVTMGLKQSESASHKQQEMILDLQRNVEGMKEFVSKQELETSDILNQWKTRCADLEEQTSQLETEIQSSYEINSPKASELESVVKSLEESLETQQQEFSDVIEQWSASCEELKEEARAKTIEMEHLTKEMSDVQQSSQDINSQVEQEKETNASLTEYVAVLEHELSTARTKLEEILAEKTNAENDLQQKLQDQADTITEQIEHLNMHKKKIEDLQNELLKTKGDCDIAKECVQQLEDEVARVKDDTDNQDEELKASVQESESRIVALEEEKANLLEDIQKSSLEAIRIKELFEMKEGELTAQLQEEDHARLLAEQSSSDALQEMGILEKQSEDVIQQWQERVEELEMTVEELELQLEQQQSEATEAIAQWEATCSDNETKARDVEFTTFDTCEKLRDMFIAEKRKQLDWISKLDSSYQTIIDFSLLEETSLTEFPVVLSSQTEEHDSNMLKAIATLHASREEIEFSLKANENELELIKKSEREQAALSMKLGEDCIRLESELKALALRFEERTNSLENSNKEKQRNISDFKNLRSQLLGVEQELARAVQDKKSIEDKNSALKDKITEIESELKSSKVERVRFGETLGVKRELMEDMEEELAAEKKEAEDRLSAIHDLQKEVDQLTDELELANESLQVYLTDEISKRATNMATEALRSEVGQLKSKIDNKHEMLVEERRARKAAEQNVISLKDDLALVLQVSADEPDSDDRVKNLVVTAEDLVHRKERKEITKLRSSLERSIQELDLSRDSETEAKNRALAAEAQASISEQEIVAAKADVAFLKQSLEDGREADAARVASFEYRISALEDDRDVMRRVHADELETLRAEISQTLMEKDRIFHALKESEKANAALVYATTKETETDHTSHVGNEISKLRASNAHLLAAATEEAANAERRIREAVNANASLVEANMIVERELRVAAETAVENVKAQLDEARRSQEEGDSESHTMKQLSATDRLLSQLTQSRTKGRKLEVENAELKVDIENLRSTTEQRILDLTEQCRRAQASAMKLEGEARFGSEVSTEVKKLHSLQNTYKPENWVLVNDENAEPLTKTKDSSAMEAYDYIIEQKIAIQEERNMYQELLVEHDSLLALLAQQDLEKESLNTALADAAGTDAVEAAILEAEEKAIQQFGKYIQVT